VSVGTVFERFPASVRGAVVARGLDREPHQIRLREVTVVAVHDPTRPVQSLTIEPVTVDVAPHRDVMIPFDVPFSLLEPGWYCVVAEVEVDGSFRARGPEGGGKRFVVPWPTEDVRRADLRPNLEIKLPDGTAIIERIELKADRTNVRWNPSKAEGAELRVSAGRRRLPTVETVEDSKTGSRVTVTHPVPKRATELTFDVAAPSKARGTATLPLP
jgi:hypothetical protein